VGKVPALPLETRLPWSGRPDLTDDLCVPNRDRPPTAPRADRTRLVAGWRDRVRLAATTADRAMDARCWEEADADPLRVMHRASVRTGSVPSGSNWWQGVGRPHSCGGVLSEAVQLDSRFGSPPGSAGHHLESGVTRPDR
jgi:hypothetical protein